DYGEELIIKEDDGVNYWTHEGDNFYMARYEDIIFVTNQDSYRGEAVDRLLAGDGFVMDEKVMDEYGLEKDNLGYFYMSEDGFMGLVKDVYVEMGMDSIVKYMDVIGDMYAVMTVGKDEIRFSSVAKITDMDSEYVKSMMDYDMGLA